MALRNSKALGTKEIVSSVSLLFPGLRVRVWSRSSFPSAPYTISLLIFKPTLFPFHLTILYFCWHFLLSLDVTLDLGDLDLHGIQLLVQHQGDVGCSLGLVHCLEAEIRERDVPFTVVLLGFAGGRGEGGEH